jgi:hypothetical protein
MEQLKEISEESLSSGNNKRKIKEETKLQFRRAQSLKTNANERTDYEDGVKNELKPKRSASSASSSTAVRIQVTFHRPLTWQVSSSSSSSAPIPKKSIRRIPVEKEPRKSEVNPNDFVNIKLNGNHIGRVQPPQNEEDEFTFEIPIETCEIARRNHRTQRVRGRNHQGTGFTPQPRDTNDGKSLP